MQQEYEFILKGYKEVQIYLYKEGFRADDLEPITDKEVVKTGVQVLVPDILGGYHIMTVTKSENIFGEVRFDAANDKLITPLSFGNDDRNCWTCSYLLNRKVPSLFKDE